MNKINDSKSFRFELASVLIICVSVLAMNLWFIRYDTNDDMMIALTNYSYWPSIAKSQARISFYIAGLFAMLPHIFNDINYLSAVRIFGLLALLASVGTYFSVLLRDWRVAPISILITTLLWTNTLGGHNMLVAYPFYIVFNAALFLFLMTLITLSVREEIKINSAFLFSITILTLLMSAEIYLQYVPFVFVLIFYLNKNENHKSIREFKSIRIPAIAITITFVVAVVFRILNPSEYSGNSTLNFDISKVSKTFFVLTFGLFPGVQPILNISLLSRAIVDAPFKMVVPILSTFAFIFILLRMRSTLAVISTDKLNKLNLPLLIAVYLSALIAPNFLISLTVKYQSWVHVYGTTNYLYSSLSYLVAALFISNLIVFTSRKPVIYTSLAMALVCLVLLTQVNNSAVGTQQRADSEKWDFFDAAIENIRSMALDDKFVVGISPSFFEGIPQQDYWYKYASSKLHFPGAVVQGKGGDAYISYTVSSDNEKIALVGTDEQVDFIFTKKFCEPAFPCYLSELHKHSKNSLATGKDFGGSRQRVVKSPEMRLNGVYGYKINPSIARSSVIGFSQYDFEKESDTETTIDFMEGVYGLESSKEESWRWATNPVKMSVRSTQAIIKKITMDVMCVQDMNLSIAIGKGNNTQNFFCSSKGSQKIYFIYDFAKGPELITIQSDVSPIKLSDSDPRYFSFQIKSIVISTGEL